LSSFKFIAIFYLLSIFHIIHSFGKIVSFCSAQSEVLNAPDQVFIKHISILLHDAVTTVLCHWDGIVHVMSSASRHDNWKWG